MKRSKMKRLTLKRDLKGVMHKQIDWELDVAFRKANISHGTHNELVDNILARGSYIVEDIEQNI